MSIFSEFNREIWSKWLFRCRFILSSTDSWVAFGLFLGSNEILTLCDL